MWVCRPPSLSSSGGVGVWGKPWARTERRETSMMASSDGLWVDWTPPSDALSAARSIDLLLNAAQSAADRPPPTRKPRGADTWTHRVQHTANCADDAFTVSCRKLRFPPVWRRSCVRSFQSSFGLVQSFYLQEDKDGRQTSTSGTITSKTLVVRVVLRRVETVNLLQRWNNVRVSLKLSLLINRLIMEARRPGEKPRDTVHMMLGWGAQGVHTPEKTFIN